MSDHGIGGAIDAERFLVCRAGADHAEPPVVIDVRSLQTHAGELAHQVGFLGRQARAGEDGERIVAVRGLDALNLGATSAIACS